MATDFSSSKIVVARIQNRRGNRVNLPQPLEPGELGWCLDTKQLFIGLDAQDAISGIELFQGQVLNGQNIVQGIINYKILQFVTKKRRLYNAVQLIQDVNTKANESDLLQQLGLIPSSVFVDPQNRDVVTALEQNITILRDLNDVVLASVEYGARHGTSAYEDFRPGTLITYDWTETVETQAEVTPVVTAGAITGFIIDNAGLGYLVPPSVTISNYGGGPIPGSGASATAIISSDGEGRVIGFTINNPGTGYDINTVVELTAPTQSAITATATANIVSGSIQSITLLTPGAYYGGSPEVTIVGNGINAKFTAIVDLNTGFVTGFTPVNTGSGYTTATVVIQAPLSNSLYSFIYDVGLGDSVGGSQYPESNTSLSGPDDTSAAIDGRLEFLINYMNTAALSGADTITNPKLDSFGSGTLGNPDNFNLNPFGNKMINGFLFLTTPRQSSNVAALINSLSNYDKGYVTTKQNVEIITELTTAGVSPDTLYDAVYTYELPASAIFTKVQNPAQSDSSSLPLEYSIIVSDIQFMEYSLHSGPDFQQAGKLTVVCNPLIVGSESTLSDQSVEIRNNTVLNTDSPTAPDVEFSTSYDAVTKVVSVMYRHQFGAPVIMKVIARRWKSFDDN
jgi:hypothetical protein